MKGNKIFMRGIINFTRFSTNFLFFLCFWNKASKTKLHNIFVVILFQKEVLKRNAGKTKAFSF